MLRPHARIAFLALVIAALVSCAAAPAAYGVERWTWPVNGPIITSYRNGDDPYAGGQHRGIDVAAEVGTPVLAATGGNVRFAGVAGSSGLAVSVRTSDGRFDTSYLHLSAVDLREGDYVDAGARIGAVGTSGRRSAAAPHLHFGVREAGSRHAYRDPLDFLRPLAPGPVREGPRGGPVPVVAPVRVRPVPVPVRRPFARSRRRIPAGRRVRVPAGRRIRVPVRSRVPRALPRLGPVSVPAAHPAGAPTPANEGLSHSPSAGPAPVLDAPAQATPRHLPAGRPSPTADSAVGPNLGWALACTGLLLAAACLGRPSGGDAESEGGRRALWSFLRPLLGRR